MPYQWLSWIYHLGMVISIAGFMLSALLSFEKEINLKPQTPQQIYTQSPDTRFNRMLRQLGINIKSKEGFEVVLKEFSTEYTEGMKLNYPKAKLSRLAIGLGWKTEKFSQEVKLIPKRYISRVAIYEGENLIKEKDILVNHPLRYKGVTLYLMGYEQTFKLIANSHQLELKGEELFKIPDISGRFTGVLKRGVLYKKNGVIEKINPYIDLSYSPDGKSPMLSIGQVGTDKPLLYKGVNIRLVDFSESSILSYRKDPAQPILWIGITAVFFGMLFRIFGWWYRVQLLSEDGKIYILISTRGLLANRDRVIRQAH